MSKRIRNYRTGDRAEDFGIFLLRAFCAVAPIPRQEDFGLADAVATLLRPEGRFWYAEDSFLVQFKSRTEKKVTLEGPVFERWLAQDLSILVGRVNLIENTIELFTVGAALFDRRLSEGRVIGGRRGIRTGLRLADRANLAVFLLDPGMRLVSNACSGEPDEVRVNKVNAHLGNPG